MVGIPMPIGSASAPSITFIEAINASFSNYRQTATATSDSHSARTPLETTTGLLLYAEVELTNLVANQTIGLSGALGAGYSEDQCGIYFNGASGASGVFLNNTTGNNHGTATGFTFATSGIVMFATDLANSKMWFGYNGTWYNSGDPAAGTNPTFNDFARSSCCIRCGGAFANGASYTLVQPSAFQWKPSGYDDWPAMYIYTGS